MSAFFKAKKSFLAYLNDDQIQKFVDWMSESNSNSLFQLYSSCETQMESFYRLEYLPIYILNKNAKKKQQQKVSFIIFL